MFKFCNLYSGSSGNCSFICTENVNILIDCGETQKKIITALESIGKNISKIDAIIVTHEHSDHVKNLGSISKKYNIPIFILGNGSNVIVKDKGIRGITIILELKEIEIKEEDGKVAITVGAGVKLGMLAGILQKKAITGFEFASRNSRNNRRSNPHECRSLWKRNERNCTRSYIY